MWIYDFTIFVFSICFLYLDSGYLFQLILVALNSHFHKLSKSINVFVFIKGNTLQLEVVVIQDNFLSMFHKNDFSRCEIRHRQYPFFPQHLILSWYFFWNQAIESSLLRPQIPILQIHGHCSFLYSRIFEKDSDLLLWMVFAIGLLKGNLDPHIHRVSLHEVKMKNALIDLKFPIW